MSKYTYNQHLSRLRDLLELPTYCQIAESSRYDENKALFNNDYAQDIDDMLNNNPKWKTWALGYDIENHNPFSFGKLVFWIEKYSISDYDTLKATLKAMPEDELRKHCLKCLLYGKRSDELDATAENTLADSLKKPESWARLVDERLSSGEEKWWYLKLLNQPQAAIDDYFGWLDKIEPIFNVLWNKHSAQADGMADYLVRDINANGLAVIKPFIEFFSKNTTPFEAVLSGDDKTVQLLISLVYTTGLGVHYNPASAKRYLIFGIDWQNSLIKIDNFQQQWRKNKITLFKNLGDQTRYEVFMAILNGADNNKELAKKLGVSSATISYHINQLVVADILQYDMAKTRFGYVVNKAKIVESLRDFIAMIEDMPQSPSV